MSDVEYVVWKCNPTGGFCTLEYLENVPDSYELEEGVPRAENFPNDACFRMKAASPKNVKLPDNACNLDSLVVVSQSLKEHLKSLQLPDVEFLQVTVINHKGRVASEEYYVVNPLVQQDCIDKQGSKLEWNDIDPTSICSCFKLVLLDDKIDPKWPMFRLQHLPLAVLIRNDLADAIAKQGFTGLRFKPIDQFIL